MCISGWGKQTHPSPHTPEGSVLPLPFFLQTVFPSSVDSNPISHKVWFNASMIKHAWWQLNELTAVQTRWWNLEQTASIKRTRISTFAVSRNKVSLGRTKIWQGKESNTTALAQCLRTNSTQGGIFLKCSPDRLGCYYTTAHKQN